jgi:hypothetical protein
VRLVPSGPHVIRRCGRSKTVPSSDARTRQDSPGSGWGGYLVSEETFGDFELIVESNPDWPADTGIYLRKQAHSFHGIQGAGRPSSVRVDRRVLRQRLGSPCRAPRAPARFGRPYRVGTRRDTSESVETPVLLRTCWTLITSLRPFPRRVSAACLGTSAGCRVVTVGSRTVAFAVVDNALLPVAAVEAGDAPGERTRRFRGQVATVERRDHVTGAVGLDDEVDEVRRC